MLPSWTPLVLIITIAVHGSAFVFCDTQLQANESGNPLKTLKNHLTFAGCTTDPSTGQPGASFTSGFQWFLFLIGTLPILLLIYTMIAPLVAGLLANSIAGTIGAIAGFAALLVFFGLLIAA